MPLSATDICANPFSLLPVHWAETIMWPCGVNLSALPIRFVSTCFRRVGSPITFSGSASLAMSWIFNPFCLAVGVKPLTTSSSALRIEKGMNSKSNFPASILEKSRISFMRLRRELPDDWM